MVMPRLTILGAGPAGLLAAHAAVQSGAFGDIAIVTNGGKSVLHGAQYLHADIPGLCLSDPIAVRQSLMSGTPEEYAYKVYHETYDPRLVNSAQVLDGETKAWDIREAYFQLWARYSPLIIKGKMDVYEMESLLRDTRRAGRWFVFSTIPRKAICHNHQHQFASKQIWAAGETPDRKLDGFGISDGSIILNAGREPRWYRLSHVFGMKTVEWPDSKTKPPVSDVAHVTKPLSTNCDCWMAEGAQFLGRYGKWQKGVLAHTAYEEAAELIQQWMEQGIL